MKTRILVLISLLFIGCGESSPQPFSFEQAVGIWVPYEIKNEDGTISKGSFTASSFFGVYAESFKLTADKTFIPVTWTNKQMFNLKLEEKGICAYSSDSKKIIFSGVWKLEFDLIKFEKNELWLKSGGVLYKFKREM
jgi:hypothetical protein